MSSTCPICAQPVPDGLATCPRDGAPVQLEPTVVRRAEPLPQLGANPNTDRTVVRRLDEPSADSLVGRQIGEYVIRRLIGEGGMGQVYEGVHPMIGKRVGIKVLRHEIAGNTEEGARLLTEARSANSIGHRGIIDIFGFGALPDGRQYFIMEYLVGRSLGEYIAEFAPVPLPDALQIIEEILGPLGAAHTAGVIHRDLKPNNIFLVDQPDGTMFVKILDFGLAKQGALAHGDTPQTRVARVIGTPEYMAPEQARGDSVSPRTDLYALGVVAYEMITGILPFSSGSAWETVMAHVISTARPPSALVSDLPADVEALVMRLMARESVDRPESAEEARAEVRRIRQSLNVDATRLVMLRDTTTPEAQAVVAPRRALETTMPEAQALVPPRRTSTGEEVSQRSERSERSEISQKSVSQKSGRRSAPRNPAVRATPMPAQQRVDATAVELPYVPRTRPRPRPLALLGIAAVVFVVMSALVLAYALSRPQPAKPLPDPPPAPVVKVDPPPTPVAPVQADPPQQQVTPPVVPTPPPVRPDPPKDRPRSPAERLDRQKTRLVWLESRWQRERATRSANDVRIFDQALLSLKKEAADIKLKDARRDNEAIRTLKEHLDQFQSEARLR